MIQFEQLKKLAGELCFVACATCDVEPFDEWQEKKTKIGNMRLANLMHDPKQIMPNAKQLIVLLYPYEFFKAVPDDCVPVSAYCFASHASYLATAKLTDILIKEYGVNALSNPRLPTKPIAQRAGIGWYGRNGLIYSNEFGSCVAISKILIDDFVEGYKKQESDKACPTNCTKCISACPTCAIHEYGVVDIDRCIRAHQLSGKPINESALPFSQGFLKDSFLGCDICQRVCPKNLQHSNGAYNDQQREALNLEAIFYNSQAQAEKIAQLIGKNEAIPNRMLTQAVLCARLRHLPILKKLAMHPSQSVSRNAILKIDMLVNSDDV